MRVAFVLSGGASLGACQAGMLEALYERGIRADMIVGSSVGAINGAFIASRPPTVDTARKLQGIWTALNRSQVLPANPLAAGLGLLGKRDHIVPVDPLRRLVRSHVEFQDLEEAAVEIHVIAADSLTGEEVRLSRGPAVQAILASAAIPGVFPCVHWDGRRLMDGGAINNTPISHAVELGADRVIVLPAIGGEQRMGAPRGALAAGLLAISHILARRLAEDIARYEGDIELTVLPAPAAPGLPTDFTRARELIADGLSRARWTLARRPRRRGRAAASALRRVA